MKIYEIDKPKIRYKTIFKKKISSNLLKSFIKNRLYTPGAIFNMWWNNPNIDLSEGAIISILYIDEKPKGLAIINLNPHAYVKLRTHQLPENYDLFGIIGFFITPKYRKQGFASKLAKNLENKFLNTYPEYKQGKKIPVVAVHPRAKKVAEKAFNRIKVIDVFDYY